METKKELESELVKVKEQLQLSQNRAFVMLIEIVVVIGVPAIAAVLLKKYALPESGTGITVLLVGAALLISWSIIIYRGIQFSNHFNRLKLRKKEIEAALEENKDLA